MWAISAVNIRTKYVINFQFRKVKARGWTKSVCFCACGKLVHKTYDMNLIVLNIVKIVKVVPGNPKIELVDVNCTVRYLRNGIRQKLRKYFGYSLQVV